MERRSDRWLQQTVAGIVRRRFMPKAQKDQLRYPSTCERRHQVEVSPPGRAGWNLGEDRQISRMGPVAAPTRLIFMPPPFRMPSPIPIRYAYEVSRSKNFAPQEAAAQAQRHTCARTKTAISTTSAEMVRAARARPALAENFRPLSYSGVGGDVAADTSGSRHSEIP